jgi:Na+/H+-dicarboxylate symporter
MRLALHWQILITMVVGAAGGILVNATGGTFETDGRVPVAKGSVHLYGMSSQVQLQDGTVWVEDTPNQVLMELDTLDEAGEVVSRQRVVVRGPVREVVENWPSLGPEFPADQITRLEVPTVGQLEEKDASAYVLFQLHGRSTARRVGDLSKSLGNLFLRLLKMVSVPLIIASLITGVVGLGHADRLGRMFGRTLLYYVTTSMLAIVTGLMLVNLIQPGRQAPVGVNPPPAAGQAAAQEQAEAPKKQRQGKGLGTVLFEQVENMIPPNPFQSVAEGNFLPIICFSIAFGVFTILVGGKTRDVIADFTEAAFEVIMRMTMAIIRLAPIGVLFLMFSATAGQGVAVFGILGWYMVTVALALLIHATVILPAILKFVARRNPVEYMKAMSPALLTAFSSASSNGTLPLTMTCAEERAGVSNRVTSFVLPLGATVNMDGTALYEVVAVLFIAQLTPGIELTMVDQIVVAFTALLASIGAAGIPHAGLIMMVIILQAVGLPTESQGMIIAVDRVLDMCRTSVNVWSDACGCAVVSRFEAE